MMRSLTTASTGMVAQQHNLDIIANNLANVNTTGFKAQRAEFEDLMYQTMAVSGATVSGENRLPGSQQVGLGVRFAASGSNFREGNLQSTGDVLDVAIIGDGFFQVEQPDGSTAYTRDGDFKVDSQGQLVNSSGFLINPAITIPTGVTGLTISETGVISGILPGTNEPSELGNMQIAIFPNPAGLTRIGKNLYAAGGASGDAQTVTPGDAGAGKLQSGSLEGSNVEIVQEMVYMILAQRAYEINSKAIQTADDMLGVLNNLKR